MKIENSKILLKHLESEWCWSNTVNKLIDVINNFCKEKDYTSNAHLYLNINGEIYIKKSKTISKKEKLGEELRIFSMNAKPIKKQLSIKLSPYILRDEDRELYEYILQRIIERLNIGLSFEEFDKKFKGSKYDTEEMLLLFVPTYKKDYYEDRWVWFEQEETIQLKNEFTKKKKELKKMIEEHEADKIS